MSNTLKDDLLYSTRIRRVPTAVASDNGWARSAVRAKPGSPEAKRKQEPHLVLRTADEVFGAIGQ